MTNMSDALTTLLASYLPDGDQLYHVTCVLKVHPCEDGRVLTCTVEKRLQFCVSAPSADDAEGLGYLLAEYYEDYIEDWVWEPIVVALTGEEAA